MRRSMNLLLLLVFVWGAGQAAEKRMLAPRDCVQVRYIVRDGDAGLYGAIKINPQGTRVAYLVKSPDLSTNRDDLGLYVKDIHDGVRDGGRLLAAGENMSHVTWLGDGTHLVLLMGKAGRASLVKVDARSGKTEVLFNETEDIKDYSIDRNGRTIVYTVAVGALGKAAPEEITSEQAAAGYLVTMERAAKERQPYANYLFVRRRLNDGGWSAPENIAINDPFTKRRLSPIPFASMLSLSPDGSKLALAYATDGVPDEWRENPWVRTALGVPAPKMLPVLYDLVSRETRVALKTLQSSSVAFWSPDSQSLVLNAHPPVGSKWVEESILDRRTAGGDANMFWIPADREAVEEIAKYVVNHHEPPLAWTSAGDVIVHVSGATIARFRHGEGTWRQVEQFTIPLPNFHRYAPMASDGEVVLGVYETPVTPPDLFLYDRKTNDARVLTNLNSQLDQATLAPVELIHWKTTAGTDIAGWLFKPPGYRAGQRYPLVIQTKGNQGWFACDSGFNHDPAFAPQPIANAGMMYLIRTVPEGYNQTDERALYPKDLPGGVSEAAYSMDLWESAVRTLDERGLIDPSKVGIIGFSRTGWHVEYFLAHSKVRFAAATATDNIQYSLGEYWITHSEPTMRHYDAMYGGPPYGATLRNWLNHSISFNLDKIHTPLLMEEMGYGVYDDTPGKTPTALAGSYEVFSGLQHLGKPVELYYYPGQVHTPASPIARLFTLQRNTDWYRFWLMDEEDPDPTRSEQYLRWRKLREMRDQDQRQGGHSTLR